MGSGSLIKLSLEVLSGPLISVLYPLVCTVQAIESGPATDHRPLLTYWVLYSIITLFEAAFSPILAWLPWDVVKTILNVILILPYFNGSAIVYDQLKAGIDGQAINFSPDIPYVKNLFTELLGILSSAGNYINATAQGSSRPSLIPTETTNEFRYMPTSGSSFYNYPGNTNYTEFYTGDDDDSAGLRSESTTRNRFNYPELNPPDHPNNSSRSGHSRLKTVPVPRSTFNYTDIYTDLYESTTRPRQ